MNKEIPKYNYVKYSSALLNRAVYGGVYTSDLTIIALSAFIVSKLFEGYRIELMYSVIGLVCIPLYCFLIIKNRWLPKGWFIFLFRSLIGCKHKEMIIN